MFGPLTLNCATIGWVSGLQSHLQSQMHATRLELAEAQKRKASLQAAIDAKKEPIALARHRYQMRKQRPTRELVHDEVRLRRRN